MKKKLEAARIIKLYSEMVEFRVLVPDGMMATIERKGGRAHVCYYRMP